MDYIPARDADFDSWADNFQTLIAADPEGYGLVAADATEITARYTAWNTAYQLAVSPTSNTTANVAAKDNERATAEPVFRLYAMQINANPTVTDQQRADLGLTIRKTSPTPVPPPTTAPDIELRSQAPLAATFGYSDPDSPDGKAKPDGVIGVQMFVSYGDTPATDPEGSTLAATATKAPFTLPLPAAQRGKYATFFGRWVTRGGPGGVQQEGPFSVGVPIVVS